MKRAIAISLVLIASMAVIIPLSYSSAASRNFAAAIRRHRGHRHSRAWWRRYMARLRKQRANLAQRRSVKPRQQTQAKQTEPVRPVQQAAFSPGNLTGGGYTDPNGLFSIQVPEGWTNRPVYANGESKFYAFAPDGEPAGQAALSAVGSAVSINENSVPRSQRKFVGGRTFFELRRVVIDRMLASGGWVVNDFERQIGGRRVFVVVSQSGSTSAGTVAQRTWTHYFVELDGRIFNLVTNAPVEQADRIATSSEKMLGSLSSTDRSRVAIASGQQ